MKLFARAALVVIASSFSHAALAADVGQAMGVPGAIVVKGSSGVTFAYTEDDFESAEGKYRCGGTTRIAADAAAVEVSRALAKIDRAVAEVKLRYVLLCSSAAKSGKSAGGVAVTAKDLLVLGIANGTTPDEQIQTTTLHEFYHLSEYRLGGTDDPVWNDKFTGYDLQEGSWRASGVGGGGRNFLNQYSHSFAREERAELFAALVINSRAVGNYADINNDQVLRNKAEYVAERANRVLGLSLKVD